MAPTKSFQIPQVAPGEIVDRNRAGPAQTLGYPLASLRALLLSAEIMRNAGFRPMQFIGPKGPVTAFIIELLRLLLHHFFKFWGD